MPIISGDGGGAGLPSQWTVDANGNVLIAPSAAAANPPKASLTVQPPAASLDYGLRINDPNGSRVATISGNVGTVDAVRCSFGGYGSDYIGGDPIAGEDQDSGNVIFEVKDGGGMNVWAADGTTKLLSVSAAGLVDMPQLPTADPLVAGRLYSVAGTLHVSAG